jgi:hypothetical protein
MEVNKHDLSGNEGDEEVGMRNMSAWVTEDFKCQAKACGTYFFKKQQAN